MLDDDFKDWIISRMTVGEAEELRKLYSIERGYRDEVDATLAIFVSAVEKILGEEAADFMVIQRHEDDGFANYVENHLLNDIRKNKQKG